MAIAHINSGSLTGVNDATPTFRIKVAGGTYTKTPAGVYDKTGSGDGQVAQFDASGRIVTAISIEGWYQTTADSGSSYSNVFCSSNMGSLSGTRIAEVTAITVQKRTKLTNITSATTAIPNVAFDAEGQIVYAGNVRGFLSDDEQLGIDDPNGTPDTLVIPLGTGTLSASAIVTRETDRTNFREGGAIPYDYDFLYSDTVTVTTNPFSLSSFTASLNLDTGATIGGTVLFSSLTAVCDYAGGANTKFIGEGVFTGAVTEA